MVGTHKARVMSCGFFSLIALVCVAPVYGCGSRTSHSGTKTEGTPRATQPVPVIPLSPEFLKRAHSALLERVGSQAQLLEMRAKGRHLSFIAVMGDRLKQVDYVEQAALHPGQDGAPSTGEGTPVGKIYGPDAVEMSGDGPLAANLFPLAEISLHGIAQSFPVARQAVDPENGRITELVVRRFLPFSSGIRARIYVDSPKMSGSIDTNERGIPLKKR